MLWLPAHRDGAQNGFGSDRREIDRSRLGSPTRCSTTTRGPPNAGFKSRVAGSETSVFLSRLPSNRRVPISSLDFRHHFISRGCPIYRTSKKREKSWLPIFRTSVPIFLVISQSQNSGFLIGRICANRSAKRWRVSRYSAPPRRQAC